MTIAPPPHRSAHSDSAPNAAQLAAGIWEALITTIMGLCVAIYTGCLLGVCQGFPL